MAIERIRVRRHAPMRTPCPVGSEAYDVAVTSAWRATRNCQTRGVITSHKSESGVSPGLIPPRTAIWIGVLGCTVCSVYGLFLIAPRTRILARSSDCGTCSWTLGKAAVLHSDVSVAFGSSWRIGCAGRRGLNGWMGRGWLAGNIRSSVLLWRPIRVSWGCILAHPTYPRV